MAIPISFTKNYLVVREGLLRIHALGIEGKFESAEAEAVREAMELPWQALTDIEKKRIEGLSHDLYIVEETTAACEPQAATLEAQNGLALAAAARNRGEWDLALDLLRTWERSAHAAFISYLRGTIWRFAGDPEVALVFFEHAARLNLDAAEFQSVYSNVLKFDDFATPAAT